MHDLLAHAYMLACVIFHLVFLGLLGYFRISVLSECLLFKIKFIKSKTMSIDSTAFPRTDNLKFVVKIINNYYYWYVGCGHLLSPSNGYVSISSDGTTAYYTCYSGYRRTGSSTRTCLNTGVWSGSVPFCTLLSQTGRLTAGPVYI